MADQLALQQAVQITPVHLAKAVVLPQDPGISIHQLVCDLQLPSTVSADLELDIREQARAFARAVGAVADVSRLHLKLEVLNTTTCPKWHADYVTARMLCTYVGPGTQYIPNEAVQRKKLEAVVRAQDSKHEVQVAAGDLLLLKGHGWPGFHGKGAVHRSPQILESQLRLVLTIDDAHAPGCACFM